MTIAVLLVTALATGYAAAVVLRSKLRPWAALLALLCYLLAGVQLALLFTLGGGVLLPGRQLNPAIVAEWQQVLSGTPLLSPWLTLVTLLAGLMVAAAFAIAIVELEGAIWSAHASFSTRPPRGARRPTRSPRVPPRVA